jgi:hypothetical protein
MPNKKKKTHTQIKNWVSAYVSRILKEEANMDSEESAEMQLFWKSKIDASEFTLF